MKTLKNILFLVAVSLLALSSNAQTTKTKTTTTTEAKKSADEVNKSLKGPNGETVYTGPRDGNYYMGKDGKKVYLKKEEKTKTTTTTQKGDGKVETKTDKKTETKTEEVKMTDKIDKTQKGPNGETVYTGPKGGSYYMKDGKKAYLKK